jgi:hypothetical protein
MKMGEVTSAADGLDPKNRAATVKLIDLKVEDDMKEILNAMHHEFALIRNEFGLLKTELVHMDNKFDSKFKEVENRISTGYTVFGIACTIMAILLAALGIMLAIK